MTKVQNNVWYTNDEKKFIKGLGKDGGRLDKLLKYQDTIAGRVLWGHVSRTIISNYVEKEIRDLRQKDKLNEYYSIRGF